MAFGALAISASGLHSSIVNLRASAHNIANINTNGFKSQEVVKSSLSTGGVSSIVRQTETPGELIFNPLTGEIIEDPNAGFIIKDEMIEGSNVNTVIEMVNLISAGAHARSNANAIRAEDDILGLIVNLIA